MTQPLIPTTISNEQLGAMILTLLLQTEAANQAQAQRKTQ